MMSSKTCIFQPCSGKAPWINCKSKSIERIVQCSRNKNDLYHEILQKKIDREDDIWCHKGCYCTYTSNTRRKGRKRPSSCPPQCDRLLKSSVPMFTREDFKHKCFFCTQPCFPKDHKNPSRWRRWIQCETESLCDDEPTFKDKLLDICDERQDDWSKEIYVRLQAVATSLPAYDGRYHLDCYNNFRKVPKDSTQADSCKPLLDQPLQSVVQYMNSQTTVVTWTVAELYDKYVGASGHLTRKQMLHNLCGYFGEDVVVLSVPGCETEIGFRKIVGKTLKITKKSFTDHDDDITNIVSRITSEVTSIPMPRDYKLSDFHYEQTIKDTSVTLLQLISQLISDGQITKKVLTLAQCIQQHIGIGNETRRNQTSLGLAIKLHHKHGSSELIRLLHEHGITSSYDEVIRFRKSAASYVSNNSSTYNTMLGLTTEIGPIFGWCDNYDLWIASPNGTKSTHAMVSEFTVHPRKIEDTKTPQLGVMSLTVPRLKKSEASRLHLREPELLHYTGEHKVNPPCIVDTPLSPTDCDNIQASLVTAYKRDAAYFQQLQLPDAIEFSGYNAREDRNEDFEQKPKTLFVFGPLLNSPPSHPDTVITTLQHMVTSMKAFGMTYANICMDMQLYIVSCKTKWSDIDRWKYVILHPGMMHTIMSFLGCIGTLMHSSGIEVILAASFGSLKSIMSGKAWPQALRAYRMLTGALLQDFLSEGQQSYEDIQTYLEQASKHPTGKLWVNCLIKPTLIAHRFIRAEREGNLLLREKCIEEMIPYFFSAGHFNYARYLSHYLGEVRNLPSEARQLLLEGCQVCRHNDGSPAVSADQFGEQTYIKQGKGSGGLKGISTDADQVAIWVNSFSICTHLSLSLDELYCPENEEKDNGRNEKPYKHKEEGKKRMQLDEDDRNKICQELQKHSHPLQLNTEKLYNIVNGQCAPPCVNVQEAEEIGKQQMIQFKASLPDGFHKSIEKKVKTMQSMKKVTVVDKKEIYDMEALFARLIAVGHQRNLDLEDIFKYELSAIPSSIVDDFGYLRKGDKSVLVRRCLGILLEEPNIPSTVMIDGNQLLYHIPWPVPGRGKVADIAQGMKERLRNVPGEKLIIFDRYENTSAKEHERQRRAGEGSIEYNLELNTLLPGREAIMKNTSNKKQLCQLLCTFDIGDDICMIGSEQSNVQHDEADVTIISYTLNAANHGYENIRILSDDTDIFVLLVYWTWKSKIQTQIQMEKWDGSILHVNAVVGELKGKCASILAMHSLSGCDTVSFICGRGKLSAYKVFKDNNIPMLDKIGEEDATQEQLLQASRRFFLILYGQTKAHNMNEARHSFYKKKKKPPSLKKLPPTDLNLMLHTLRAHLQVLLWKAADKSDPPAITQDITKFGWQVTDNGVMPVIADQPVAPPQLLDIISCMCSAEGRMCLQKMCKCHREGLSCTEYCKCEGSNCCMNPYTAQPENENEEDGDDEEGED